MLSSWLSAGLISLAIAAYGVGQESAGGNIVVYGHVSAGDAALSGWKVELAQVGHGETWMTDLCWNGAFEFRGVPAGAHRLRVIDEAGYVQHDEVVSLRNDGESLSIRFRTEDTRPKGRGETIAVQQLNHKSPRKATNELKTGRAALERREFARAVGHLETAVALDPASADAHNDLGAAYYQLRQYQKSVEHFKIATDLAPTHERAGNNLCMTLLRTGRYIEAAQAADGMFKRGGGSPMPHYAAAVALIAQGGNLNEAIDHLRRVQSQIPKARLLTARVLADAGRRTEAAQELEAYLRSPEADTDARRPELEAWLPELKR
jgi:Flp pilus assembly protein TadD